MNSNIDHMIEVLGWVKEGKPLQLDNGGGFSDIMPPPYKEGFAEAAVCAIASGDRYRPKPTPVRRPFTEKEAQRLVGCVLVRPEMPPFSIQGMFQEWERKKACESNWHYHLPGHPDDLKPCWVEEEAK